MRIRIHGLAAIGLLAGVAALPGEVQAATFTVTKTADTNDGVCDADCSLREAITAANRNPGADGVDVPAGTYVLVLGEHLLVTDDVMVSGALPAGSTVIEQTITKRVFQIDPAGGVNADLVNLHVRNGDAAGGLSGGNGGCIHNPYGNTLTLTDCRVTDCTAVGSGGGIWNGGTLTITGSAPGNSTIAQNSAGVDGGGINNFDDFASVSVGNTSILLNDAVDDGGGIANLFGRMTIDNSTIAQNSAGDQGAGI